MRNAYEDAVLPQPLLHVLQDYARKAYCQMALANQCHHTHQCVFLQVWAVSGALLQLARCSKATASTSQCYNVGSYTLLVMTSHILTTSCT